MKYRPLYNYDDELETEGRYEGHVSPGHLDAHQMLSRIMHSDYGSDYVHDILSVYGDEGMTAIAGAIQQCWACWEYEDEYDEEDGIEFDEQAVHWRLSVLDAEPSPMPTHNDDPLYVPATVFNFYTLPAHIRKAL